MAKIWHADGTRGSQSPQQLALEGVLGLTQGKLDARRLQACRSDSFAAPEVKSDPA